MNRKTEIRQLLSLTPAEVAARAGERLVVCPDLDALHQRMAEDIADEISASKAANQPCALILPVGPTGQYPPLVQIINARGLKLDHCWFFFMDDYCDDDGHAIPADHPLSFKGVARSLFLDQLAPASGLDPARVIFPDEHNIDALPGLIREAGGIRACFGGIGIHGHVAFNEPEPGVSTLSCRKVHLNDFTVTINAVRAGVGGNLEGFPREAYTLGMAEILSAERIRLYCRNGVGFDWANTVLRLALFGTPGDDYPVTHIRDHAYTIITDEDTLQSPQIVL